MVIEAFYERELEEAKELLGKADGKTMPVVVVN